MLREIIFKKVVSIKCCEDSFSKKKVANNKCRDEQFWMETKWKQNFSFCSLLAKVSSKHFKPTDLPRLMNLTRILTRIQNEEIINE